MTLVVGIDPVGSNHGAVMLAVQLQRLTQADIVLATVRPPTIEIPSRGNVDAEWTAFMHEQAQTALDAAAQTMFEMFGLRPTATRIVTQASVSRGLRALAAEVGATMIIIGPGSSNANGGLVLGSVAQSLLHSGETAVALAPGDGGITSHQTTRLVVGCEPDASAEAVAVAALRLAQLAHIPVVLFTAVVRATRIVAPRLGRDPEHAVLEALTEHAAHVQEQIRRAHPEIIEGFVQQGDSPSEAMAAFAWRPGDVFIVGSSTDGLLHRVFLGDTSHQLLRAARVAALVLPRT